MEVHAYPLVPLRHGCFIPLEQSHSSTLTSPGPPCHKHVHLILELMSTSLEDHRENDPPLPLSCFISPWMLSGVVIGINVCMGQAYTKESHTVHTCSLFIQTSHFPSLSVNSACVDESQWVQLEFHSRLDCSSNRDWHVSMNPLHTAATGDVYFLDPHYTVRMRRWHINKKNEWMRWFMCMS